MSMRELGRFVREERRRRHMTQAEFAEEVGIERSYLSRIEGGHGHGFGYSVMRGLATALDLPLERLDQMLYSGASVGPTTAMQPLRPGLPLPSQMPGQIPQRQQRIQVHPI